MDNKIVVIIDGTHYEYREMDYLDIMDGKVDAPPDVMRHAIKTAREQARTARKEVMQLTGRLNDCENQLRVMEAFAGEMEMQLENEQRQPSKPRRKASKEG